MKKTITLLAFLVVLIANAQTQIQLPAGYGLNGPNGFLPNVAMPFFSHDGYLYCKAHLTSNFSGFPGALFKVNEATNEVTEITGVSFPFDDLYTHSFQVYNGEIFCSLGASHQVLRINPSLNTFIKIAGIGGEYAILNDKIFGSNQVYHLATGAFSYLMDPENPTQPLPTLQGYALCNNAIYGTRTITTFPGGAAQYMSKAYKISDATVVSVLYTNSFNGHYSGFDDGKPVVFNNKILRRFTEYTNNVGTTHVESYDLDTNILNTLFTYEPTNIQGSHYVFNNNIYFNNSLDQTFVSNGTDEAVVSDVPNIIGGGSGGFSYNLQSPTYGATNGTTIQNNNKIFGCKIVFDPNTLTNVYTVRKSDGTLSGTSTIYTTINQLRSAIIVDNDLYFFKYTDTGGYGELMRYNEASNEVTNPVSFTLSSLLHGVNNSIFFYGALNGVYGLYKLNASTLSTNSFSESERLTIFPNPTNNILNISTQEPIAALKLIDITGRATTIAHFEKNKIDVSHLADGMYFLEIRTENGLFKEKFIKK